MIAETKEAACVVYMREKMKATARLALALLFLVTTVSAHFVFVVPQADGARALVFLSEELTPSSEVDVTLIDGAKLSIRDSEGRETSLKLDHSERAYVTSIPGKGDRLIHGVVDLGVMQRGEGKAHLLIYYPKTILGNSFAPKTSITGDVPVEIIPVGVPGKLRFKLLVRGKPAGNTEITVILPDGTQKKATTDSNGVTEEFNITGRYGAWARYWETAPGERQGRKYEEVRNYATLVADALPGGTASTQDVGKGKQATMLFATLPEAESSFGAVVSDGWLYVYGGHISPTHNYSTQAVSGRFDRLQLSDRKWERLPDGPSLQGMNVAAYKGKIYRIGGMSPHNKPGDKSDNWSVSDCAVFDPAKMKWEPLPPLPEPRSSHDVVVVGDKLIVVGGWSLKGAGAPEWMDTLAVLNLAEKNPKWTKIQQPFKRRALIAAAYSGKMYVIGGFSKSAIVSRQVDIFDPSTGEWTQGPELPGDDSNNGFGPAACVHEGDLYASLADGALYRLSRSAQKWEVSGRSTPRIAHRIASTGTAILVIGGAEAGTEGKNSDLIEAVVVKKQW